MRVSKLFVLLAHFVIGLQNLYAEIGDIIIMRHGQGFHNIHSIFNSNPLHPQYRPANLTRVGLDQVKEKALELAQRIRPEEITKVYISPLPRTLQTYDQLKSHINFPNASQEVEANIIEILAGELEGKKYHNYLDQNGHLSRQVLDRYGVEKDEEVIARLKVFLQKAILEHKATDKKETILVISHGTPCFHLARLLMPEQDIHINTADFIIVPQSSVLSLKQKWIDQDLLDMSDDPSLLVSPVDKVREIEKKINTIVNDALGQNPGENSWATDSNVKETLVRY